MPNFDYSLVTPGIRDAQWEAWLEKISYEEAGRIANATGLADVGDDGDFEVPTDGAYEALISETAGYYSNIK